MDDHPDTQAGHKQRLSKGQRLLRLIGSTLDPRAYLHGVRLINYYNNLHVKPRRAMTIGAGVKISPTATFTEGRLIALGDRVAIGSRCRLWAGPTRGRITLGADALLGPDILLITANYRFNDGAPVTEQAMDEADIAIGPDVWIGAKAVILPGTEIGQGAIIGAGSVVRGTVPPYAVAVGNPARVVSQRTRP